MVLADSSAVGVAWALGASAGSHLSKMAAGGPPGLVRLYQMLLLTMPGTPVFMYGDEIGLDAQVRCPLGLHDSR